MPSTTKLLKEFISLQNLRVKTFKEFEQAFQDLLTSNNQAHYDKECMNITKQFQSLSQEIRELEKQLFDTSLAKSKLVRAVQLLEREHLLNTIELQKIRLAISQEEKRLAAEELAESAPKCAHEHHHSEQADCKSYEVVYGETLIKYQQELIPLKQKDAEIIDKLNDAMEEVRYAMAEDTEE